MERSHDEEFPGVMKVENITKNICNLYLKIKKNLSMTIINSELDMTQIFGSKKNEFKKIIENPKKLNSLSIHQKKLKRGDIHE